MQTSSFELTVGEHTMRAFEAQPDPPASCAMIVIPEAFGLNDNIEAAARRVADAGMVGLAIDIFHRSGGGVAPYTDFKQVMALFEGLTDKGLIEDLDATIAHLNAQGFDDSRIAIVGFCFGGRVVFLAALRYRLGAAVTYYGGGIVSQGAFTAFPALFDEIDTIRTPWIGFFGDLDRSISVDDVERLRDALAASVEISTEIVRYAEADHGFDCDKRPSYNADVSANAWARALDFVNRHAG
jgi:carboxymethylenebutenolidase